MARVCLIRHGETDWNKETKLQGRTDIVLNQMGESQAEKVAQYLKQFTWDKIISSPLKRAQGTATIIAEVLGIEVVEIDEGLIERNYGLAEGMTLEERLEKYPNRNYEGMEEWNTLRDRLVSTVNRYAEVNNAKNIILVSHGGAINTVLYTLSNGEYGSGITKLHMGSINMFNYNSGNLDVEFYNLKSY